MLDVLRFVKGAVARKDFCPVLTHFLIDNGRIIGSNGNLALSSPIPLTMTAKPKASTFATAIANCEEAVSITQLPNGSLTIKSGSFKANVECSSDEFPSVPVGGARLDFPCPILPVLEVLERFISEDASRPWSQGILFRGQSAFVTNNVILVELWLGVQVPVEVNIPTKAVAEMLRIREEPEYFEVTENTLTVRYSGDRWLFHPTVNEGWPDAGRYLNKEYSYKPFPFELFPALQRLKPLAGKEQTVYMTTGSVRTSQDFDSGASIEVPNIEHEGKYSLPQLLLLEGVATDIDFGAKPAGFLGDKLRGVIYGMRS